MTRTADIIVIGGGMAGASAAAEIAGAGATVLLLEMESQPGYHATGRSAAMYEPVDASAVVSGLTRASGDFLRSPPADFAQASLLSPRGVLMMGYPGDEALISAAKAAGFDEVDAAFARARLPIVKTDGAIAVLWDGLAQDIDVDALHTGRLRALRRAGGTVLVDAAVQGARRVDGAWRVETRVGDCVAPVIVLAAGAWSDLVARSCGVRPVGLQPKRRSAAILAGDPARRCQLLLQADGGKAHALAGGEGSDGAA